MRPDREAVPRQVPDSANVAEELVRGEVLRERRRLRHVADVGLVTVRVREDVLALHPDRTVVGPQEADQDLQGRRLARAVRTDQADDLTRAGVEEESLEGGLPL